MQVFSLRGGVRVELNGRSEVRVNLTMAVFKVSVSANLIQLKEETQYWPKWSQDQPAMRKKSNH